MRELIKSLNSYSWAMSLFGLKQMENMLSSGYREDDRSPATKAMDDITVATRKQFGPTLDSIFKTGDALQRWTTDATLFMMFPGLMMMSQGSRDRSPDEGQRESVAEDESGATPIRHSREAASSGRKR